MKRFVYTVTAAMALSVVPAMPADAARPEITRFSDDNAGNPDYWPNICGPGADMMGVFEVKGSETVFFDADGVPVQVIVHVNFDGVLTRVDTGNSVKDPGRITINVDLATGTQTITGLDYNMIYPGLGPVFQNIGRKVIAGEELSFNAGPNDFEAFDPAETFEAACAALA
jgi:hypothetical protein